MKERGTWIALALIVALGAALRLAGAGLQPLWSDEALTILLARTPWLDLARYPLDPTGPLYYWLHAALVGDATGRLASRLPSVLFGTAAIIPAFLAGRELGGKRGGIAAALVMALSPALVDYGHEARAYALLTFLAAVAVLFGLHALRGRDRALGAFVFASLLALYTHLAAAFVVAPMMGVLGLSWLRRRQPPRWPVGAAALILLYLPELNRMRLYHKKGIGGVDWMQQPGPFEAFALVTHNWTGLALPGGLLVLAILVAALWVQRRAVDPWSLALVLSMLSSAVMLYLAGIVGKPLMLERTLLPSIVGIALLWSIVAGRRDWKLAPLIGLGVVTVGTLALVGIDRRKEQWEGAANAASAATGPLLMCPRWQAAALLASSDDSRRPDIIIPAVRGITLVPKGGPWAERLYTYQYHDEWAHRRKREQFPSRIVALPLRSVTVVLGECGADEAERMAEWFGPHAVQRLWTGRGVDDDKQIRVERWTAGPRARPVVLMIPGPERRRP